jgi:hypothetical protein
MKRLRLGAWVLASVCLALGCEESSPPGPSYESQLKALEGFNSDTSTADEPAIAVSGMGGGGGVGGGRGGGGGTGGGRGRGNSAGGGNEFSPRLASFDGNQDMQIDRSEFTDGDEEFTRMDADGDGIVTPREAHNTAPFYFDLLALFDKVDSNGDGNLVIEEWHAVFNQLDADDSRTLTREELRTTRENPFAALVLGHFSHFDLNPKPAGDQAIDVGEWGLDFDRMDAKILRNDQVTADEIKASMGARGKRLLEMPKNQTDEEEEEGAP